MRLDEFDIHDERTLLGADLKSPKEIKSALLKAGFKQAGAGVFSAVFTKTKGSRLIKVSMQPDPAYEKFIDMAMKNTANPHLPKLFWKRQFEIPSEKSYGFMLALERLSTLNQVDSGGRKKVLKFVEENLQQCCVLTYHPDVEFSYNDIYAFRTHQDFLNKVQAKKHLLYRTLSDVVNKGSGHQIDLHDENIMYRKSDNNFVITDPYAF